MNENTRQEIAISSTIQNKIPFRWTYIALPAGLLLLSIILAAVFYFQLPADIAYHFRAGAPDKTVALGAFFAWMIVPQVFFTLLAMALVRVAMLGVKYAPPGETPLTQLLPIMGNMAGLPQVIIFIAMLQFFLYNAYQTSPVPLWIIALVVLLLGGIALVILFMRIIKQFRKKKVKINQEKS
jgi:uncharacterized membrane protein